MEEMIERVAKALKAVPIRDLTDPGGELDQLRLREAARAAIEAMREPTEAMKDAGYEALLEDNWPEVWPKDQDGAEYVTEYIEMMLVWPAMIDAALSTPLASEGGE